MMGLRLALDQSTEDEECEFCHVQAAAKYKSSDSIDMVFPLVFSEHAIACENI